MAIIPGTFIRKTAHQRKQNSNKGVLDLRGEIDLEENWVYEMEDRSPAFFANDSKVSIYYLSIHLSILHYLSTDLSILDYLSIYLSIYLGGHPVAKKERDQRSLSQAAP